MRVKPGANLGVVNQQSLWQWLDEQLNREFEMSLRKASLAAALAVSMVSAPVLAQTQAASVERSGAEMEDANELRGGFIIPLIAIVAIILGILAAINDDGDPPHSP